jgi:Leucine-rich repeat (LRR) protein
LWTVSCDDCPVAAPCFGQSIVIFCDHLNLTTIPIFSKPADQNLTWDIELHNNNLKHILNGAFKHLRLRKLFLFENEIEFVDENSFEGSEDSLNVLHLYSNKLAAMPSAVGKMKQLTDLDIHRNPMDALREDVIENIASTLSSITFGNKELNFWPSCLKSLKNLISLTIYDLNILKYKMYPDDILKAYRLSELIFSNIKSCQYSMFYTNCSWIFL